MKKYFLLLIPPIFTKIYQKLWAKNVSEKIQASTPLKDKFKELNKNAKHGEIILRQNMCLNIHPESYYPMEFFCYTSEDMVEELDLFIEKTKQKKNLLDIGALHGIFSLVFALNHPERKIIAVEPSPKAFARLLYNIYKNNFNNINAVDYAISQESGQLSVHYEWEHVVSAGTKSSDAKSFNVAKKSGDKLCESLPFDPDVVKIDVEGHEVKVIKGLAATLARLKPLVFLEIHPELIKAEGDNIEDISMIFKLCGYKSILSNNTLIPLEHITRLTYITRVLLSGIN